jgi:hypothetical protein
MSNFLLILLNQKTQNLRKERVFRDRMNPLEVYNDSECVQRFRFNRQAISDICALISEEIERPTKRSQALPVVIQVCTALRFYSQGAFYRATGDCLNISKASQSRCVFNVSKALTKRVKQFIKFPKSELELNQIKQNFYAIDRMPNVIGAIDGTHIEIKTPLRDIESDYINRKNRHSINVQAVANPNLEFINVVIKYPGRVHDSFIWNNCELKNYLKNNAINGWLLGDSGYPLEKQLMTPFLNPTNESQNRYNRSHIKSRNVIERAFGVLKMRFRCLDRSAGQLMLCPERCLLVITSCFILHNISKNYNFFETIYTETEETDETESNAEVIHSNEARNIRDIIVPQNFSD